MNTCCQNDWSLSAIYLHTWLTLYYCPRRLDRESRSKLYIRRLMTIGELLTFNVSCCYSCWCANSERCYSIFSIYSPKVLYYSSHQERLSSTYSPNPVRYLDNNLLRNKIQWTDFVPKWIFTSLIKTDLLLSSENPACSCLINLYFNEIYSYWLTAQCHWQHSALIMTQLVSAIRKFSQKVHEAYEQILVMQS